MRSALLTTIILFVSASCVNQPVTDRKTASSEVVFSDCRIKHNNGIANYSQEPLSNTDDIIEMGPSYQGAWCPSSILYKGMDPNVVKPFKTTAVETTVYRNLPLERESITKSNGRYCIYSSRFRRFDGLWQLNPVGKTEHFVISCKVQ